MISSNLTKRILTGIVAGTAALSLTLYSAYSFLALLLLITALAAREWLHIGKHIFPGSRPARLRFAAGFVPYFAPALIGLALLRFTESPSLSGDIFVLSLFALVWTTDIAAYIAGKLIGGPKLLPSVSPSKTWAGLIGAVVATAAIAAIIGPRWFGLHDGYATLTGAACALLAQTGDFFESWLKRKASLKDSGNILPGHGGILDRIDGLVFVAPFYTAAMFYVLYSAGHHD